MDVVTIGYLMLGVISIAHRGYNLISDIRSTDPRLDQLYYKMRAQRRTLENWAIQMRVAAGNELALSVPPEDMNEVIEISGKLKEYLRATEAMYRKINPANRTSRVAQLRAKTLFVLQGYERLSEMVETLKILNDALRDIAPPPPPYLQAEQRMRRAVYSQLSSGGNVYSHMLFEDRPAMASDSEASTSNRQSDTALVIPSSHTVSNTQPSLPATAEITEEPTEVINTVESHLKPSQMYSTCLATISAAKNSDGESKKYLESAFSRLKLWGVGLFDSQAPLDDLIDVHATTGEPVRRMFFKCSTLLLAHTENILKATFKQHPSDQLTEVLQNLTDFLSADDLKPYLLEQLEIALEQERPSEKAVDESTLPSKPVENGKAVCQTVEFLFELLPSISILRENYFFYRHPESRNDQTQASSTGVRGSSGLSASKSVSRGDIEAIELFLKKRDQEMRHMRSHELTLYEPIFKKETERLKDYQRSKDQKQAAQVQAQALELIESLADDIKAQISLSEAPTLVGSPQSTIDSVSTKRGVVKEDDLKYFINSLQDLGADNRVTRGVK